MISSDKYGSNGLQLPFNSVTVLRRRYLQRDEKGKTKETPSELFRRVARAIAKAELRYSKKADVESIEKEFFKAMSNLEFLPNTPTLMNGGTKLGQLSACFVIPVEDSLKGIFDAAKWTAIIHQSGGGTGFSFSKLRPFGDYVKSTDGIASGPITFMTIFDQTTEVVKQGGKRRGANMGILNVDHPDIINFCSCKSNEGFLKNFNISVAVTTKFIKAVKQNVDFELINPRSKTIVGKIKARKIFETIAENAWRSGEPGIIFIDEINRHNPTPTLGKIESTNPCVSGNTLVCTDIGLRTIKELAESIDTNVATNIPSNTQRLVLVKKARAFKTGTKKLFRIKTISGYEIEATADHKFLTEAGWKSLQDLTRDDELILQNSEGKFNHDSKLPILFGTKSEWDRELGEIIGWLIGDGWLSDKKNFRVGFSFGNTDVEIFNYLEPIINRLYGYDVKCIKRDNGVLHLSYHSKYFVDFFKKLGVQAWQSNTKEVPSSIFTATREAVIGFLQGLFSSDGTVGCDKKNGNYYIRLSSKSEKLLKQTQLLLLNLGIKSKIYARHRKRRIVFNYKNVAGKIKFYESDGLLWELQINKDMIQAFLEKIGFLENKNAEKLKNMKDVMFQKTRFVDRLFSKEFIGIADVYDLTEPETHSFIANGIIVHNCGEQPLLPWESCNLGSINLSKIVNGGTIDWNKLKKLVQLGVRFLDNVIDINKYPNLKIQQITKANRKIGLGVMGFAEALIKLGVPYNSNDALQIGQKIMKFIEKEGHKTSQLLGKERGSFPNFKQSVWKQKKHYKYMRNATVTTIAPTGTISIIAGCSSGIEPLFAISFVRNVMEGTELFETNPLFLKTSKERNFFSEDLLKQISKMGTIQNISTIPDDVKKVFVTAFDISPEWHVKMQAVFQKHTDNAVSKTVNLPMNSTVNDVKKVYLMAYRLKCKGITVYRYGSKSDQVLTIRSNKSGKNIVADSEFSGGCAGIVCPH